MKTIAAAILITMLAMPAMADSPAVGYWLIERSNLTNAVNQAGGLAEVEVAVFDEIADCHGYFKGSCDLWLHARTVQFRLTATDDGKVIDYSINLSRPQAKVEPRRSQGRVEVGQTPVAKDAWEKESVVLVLKRLNLKL